MKIELKCTWKQEVNNLYEEITFKSRSCKFTIKLLKTIANKYKVGEKYHIILDNDLGDLSA